MPTYSVSLWNTLHYGSKRRPNFDKVPNNLICTEQDMLQLENKRVSILWCTHYVKVSMLILITRVIVRKAVVGGATAPASGPHSRLLPSEQGDAGGV